MAVFSKPEASSTTTQNTTYISLQSLGIRRVIRQSVRFRDKFTKVGFLGHLVLLTNKEDPRQQSARRSNFEDGSPGQSLQCRAEQRCFSFLLSAGPPITKSKIYFKAQNKKLSKTEKNNKNNKNLGRARGRVLPIYIFAIFMYHTLDY